MHLCHRCKDSGKTCCEDYPRVPLTLGDLRRISQELGTSDFFELKHYPDLSFLDAYAYDPNWRKYAVQPGDRIRQIKHDEIGRCCLVGESGCSLSMETRPLMCRIFPYNYNEFALIGFYDIENLCCPTHLLQVGETMTQMFPMSRQQVDRWRIMYYEELLAEYEVRQGEVEGNMTWS